MQGINKLVRAHLPILTAPDLPNEGRRERPREGHLRVVQGLLVHRRLRQQSKRLRDGPPRQKAQRGPAQMRGGGHRAGLGQGQSVPSHYPGTFAHRF